MILEILVALFFLASVSLAAASAFFFGRASALAQMRRELDSRLTSTQEPK